MDDLISRHAAIAKIWQHMKNARMFEEWTVVQELERLRYDLDDLPSAEPEQRWTPVTERLPEEDVEVLIAYRHKEGKGDTSHTNIDITTYGQKYFGGNRVGDNKHWRQPFQYFTSNYEVVAWMPLPEPYKED